MDFQKKYPILQLPGEHVLIQWEKGYKYVELFYKERLIGSVKGFARLKNGVTFNDAELGVIELKMSEKPIAIDLLVSGYHSPVNVTYPSKELKSAPTVFFILAFIAILGGMYQGMSATEEAGAVVGAIIIGLSLFTVAMYATTAYLIWKGHAWAFFMGGSYYTFFTLLYLLQLFAFGFYWLTVVIVIFRIVVSIIFFYYIKHAAASIRHRKYESAYGKTGIVIEILDNDF